jgi:hypothetical protein
LDKLLKILNEIRKTTGTTNPQNEYISNIVKELMDQEFAAQKKDLYDEFKKMVDDSKFKSNTQETDSIKKTIESIKLILDSEIINIKRDIESIFC